MDKPIVDKKKALQMMMFFCLIYFASYLTRNNFSAVLEGIVKGEGFAKSALGMVVSISLITYGAGQFLSGYLGDVIQPKFLLGIGLIVSSIMNILIPFLHSTVTMCVFWGVNGLAQAFMWPPLVKLMVALFDNQDYEKSIVIVSWGALLGSIVNYVVAFLFVEIASWRAVFYLSASVGAVISILIFIFCPNIILKEKKQDKNFEPKILSGRTKDTRWFSFTFVIIIICIALQGSLRDGISSWMPSFLNDEFNLGAGVSIVMGVFMPIIGMISLLIAAKLYRKIKNPISTAGVIFVLATVCSFVLVLPVLFNASIGVVPTIIATVILSGCMHSINTMLVSMAPKHFVYTGKVSLVSGVMNAFTYVGSAIATFGYPLIQEASGLGTVKIVWVITAVLGLALCFGVSKLFRKQYIERNKALLASRSEQIMVDR